jgi:hypothetical protein
MKVGPVGHVSRGHVLDVNVKSFERALKNYDPMLYVEWNPKKCKGHGCWEIRRKPEFNSALDVAEIADIAIIKVGPYENQLVHHIMDCAFLNYDQLRKLKEMDTWQYGDATQYQDLVERKTRDRREADKIAGLRRRRDAARTFKKQIRALKQYILDGGNPHRIAEFWDSVQALE